MARRSLTCIALLGCVALAAVPTAVAGPQPTLVLDASWYEVVAPFRYEQARRYEAGWSRGAGSVVRDGTVRTPLAGRVRFAGQVAGTAVVTIASEVDGVPVVVTITGLERASVTEGERVTHGEPLGRGDRVHVGMYDAADHSRYLPVVQSSLMALGVPGGDGTLSGLIANRLRQAIDGTAVPHAPAAGSSAIGPLRARVPVLPAAPGGSALRARARVNHALAPFLVAVAGARSSPLAPVRRRAGQALAAARRAWGRVRGGGVDDPPGRASGAAARGRSHRESAAVRAASEPGSARGADAPRAGHGPAVWRSSVAPVPTRIDPPEPPSSSPVAEGCTGCVAPAIAVAAPARERRAVEDVRSRPSSPHETAEGGLGRRGWAWWWVVPGVAAVVAGFLVGRRRRRVPSDAPTGPAPTLPGPVIPGIAVRTLCGAPGPLACADPDLDRFLSEAASRDERPSWIPEHA